MSEKFDIYSRKICSTPVSFGPASPDAGVELLRQLFLQCMDTFKRQKSALLFQMLAELSGRTGRKA
jgi:hypothetical protein